MINLNEVKENSLSIFNDGGAGVAKAKLSKIEKKQPSDPDASPDFKVFFEDQYGETNIAFYIPDGSDETKSNRQLARLLSLARAYFGDDYKFPEVKSYEDAYKKVMTLLKKEAIGKEFNLFVCYGYSGKPSKYLGVRMFDYVESGDVALADTKLRAKKSDVMERIEPDSSTSGNTFKSDLNDLEDLGDEDDDDDIF